MRRAIVCTLLLAGVIAAEPRTLPLAEALELAGRQSPAVQLARLRALEAELGIQAAKASYLPQASFTVNSSYRTANLQGIGLAFPGLGSRIGPYSVFDARPAMTQTLFDASLLARIGSARERAREGAETLAGVRETLLHAVVESYVRILEAGARLEASTARLATAQAVLKQTRDRKEAGTASQLDVERTARQVYEETAALERARGEREVLKTMLARLLAAPDVDYEPVALVLPRSAPDYEAALARGLRERPELRALDARLRADSYDLAAARRERLPKVAGVVDWGVTGSSPAQAIGTYNAGVAVTVPLWTGRRVETETAAAALRRRQTEENLRDTRLVIAQEVRQAEAEARSTRRELDATAGAAGAARRTLTLVRLRFEAGLATSLDVTVAQGEWTQAEGAEIATRYRHLAAYARLAYAQGNVASLLDQVSAATNPQP